MGQPRTLFQKVWDDHVVRRGDDGWDLLYIDLHLIHEVTSPQAFDGLRQAGRRVRRPERTVATIDHNLPTDRRGGPIADEIAAKQMATLRRNCQEFGIRLYDTDSPEQGIVHVIGPELGYSQPGMTIVCGDSHTSTHGAFGSIAFGIGTSEVEHVLGTQCLPQKMPKQMLVQVEGEIGRGVTPKDIALGIIGQLGTGGGAGHAIEYAGRSIRALSMEGRMTLCNMSIEAGARAGMISPDQATLDYVKDRRFAPRGQAWAQALEKWERLPSDEGAAYDAVVEIHADEIGPLVTWGTNPGMVTSVAGRVPTREEWRQDAEAFDRVLEYMDLKPGMPMQEIRIDRVFIGSCTNSRLEDLTAAARVVRGHHVDPGVRAMVVPGSQSVKAEAERAGLDRVFRDAGFEWRESGCSMCLGMNPDILSPGERCASTSNRNFEGRQGRGGRTHLVSPEMAAAAAITGHFTDIREWDYKS